MGKVAALQPYMFVCKLSDKLATVELFFMATQAVTGGNPL